MPYVAINLERWRGRCVRSGDCVVGSGQCVAFVRAATGAPPADTWTPGQRVKGAIHLQPGTAIATFIDGEYPNNSSGNHAAIYLSHGPNGIEVMDQWLGQPVHTRTISYRGSGDPSNDGETYYVIE